MEFIYLYAATTVSFVAAMAGALLGRKRPAVANWLGHGLSAIGSMLALAGAAFVFSVGPQGFTLPGDTLFGPATIRTDYLSAFFLAVIGVVGAAASVYALAYSREYYGRRLGVMAALYAAFLLSMVVVVTISHVVAFVVAWELMTVVSFLLVAHEHEKAASSRAAYIYFVMTHIGTAFIIAAFLLLAPDTGSLDFADLTVPAGWLKDAAFLCALIGFGTKAGIIPLHVWLPEAHPAAPTHVSAVMSGVMIKTAIYGLARFYLDFLGSGPLPVWWGAAVLAAAALSSVLGVLYALMQHDVKRLLAYHSVENIGIILLGMGGGLVFASAGMTALAGLAWAAALFHVLNHAIFKSLLFMAAGAVLQATHTRDIEQMGGLIRSMPYTAAFFLTGAVAIAGLPPLNGFVSEWLTFQALFALPAALAGLAGKLTAAVMVSLLGLTGALAAACFVKVFGIIFLAKPRSACATAAKEASGLMLAPMGFLAALCLGLGVLPVWLLGALVRTVASFLGEGAAAALAANDWHTVGFSAAAATGTMSPAALIVLLLAGAAIAIVLYRLCGRGGGTVGQTWTCGIVPNAGMEYTATGFSDPIRRAFAPILLPKPDIAVDAASHRYFSRRMVFHMRITYIFTEAVYRPVSRGAVSLARFMKRLQTGSVQLYVGYILAVTIAALVWSTRW